MNRTVLSEHIQLINQLPEDDKRYLYGECDRWCLDNFEDGMRIIAIMESDNHENGITHCYLRNTDTGYCYDVRGESGNDEEILLYTGIDYYSNNIEEYIFDQIDDFKKFLKWIEFEVMRTEFLAG